MTGAELLERARRQFFRAEWLHHDGEAYGVMAAGESPILLVPVDERTSSLRGDGLAGWLDLVVNVSSYGFAVMQRGARRVLLVETVDFARTLLEDESIASWSILALDGHWFRWVRS